jgi:hypothetical protein
MPFHPFPDGRSCVHEHLQLFMGFLSRLVNLAFSFYFTFLGPGGRMSLVSIHDAWIKKLQIDVGLRHQDECGIQSGKHVHCRPTSEYKQTDM